MFDERYLHDQREATVEYLKAKFNLDVSSLPGFQDFADVLLRAIISFKIWKKHLAELPPGPGHYLDEIISNLNQVLVMGPMGFRVSSTMMIRRSLDNIVGFLFYKDHPIEFFKKECDPVKRRFLKLGDCKEYIEDYPFLVLYDDRYDLCHLTNLAKKVMGVWVQQYKELSNFVHGTNRKYLELTNYLEDIAPENEALVTLAKYIREFASIANTLNIFFFFDRYRDFDEAEKSFVRQSIHESFRFKVELIEIFGEI